MICRLVRLQDCNVPLIHLLILALYKLVACLLNFRAYFFLAYFFFFFICILIFYFPLRIGPLNFQARCSERQLNLVYLLVKFILCYSNFMYLIRYSFM